MLVFILAGQSNMEGQGVVDLDGKDYNEGRGTLVSLLADPAKSPPWRHLRDDEGKWAVRDDVWVRFEPEEGPLQSGRLGVGFTAYGDAHHFGPELEFGRVVGDHFERQILLVKTAWGGKSLYRDFRPPSSGGEVGPYYKKMIAQVRASLASLKELFPAYDGGGCRLAGLVWYQGWNDGCEPQVAVPQYERNLVNLVRDLRRDLEAPDLPVVIGELTGPWVKADGEWAALRKAQAAAAVNPAIEGSAIFVATHDFVRRPEDSPCPTHGHHEFANAETYLLVGRALGEGMVKLLETRQRAAASALPKPVAHSIRQMEGWSVLVDDRLLEPEHGATGDRALDFLRARLVDIAAVVPPGPLERLRAVKIVLDLSHGELRTAQYHPNAGWLEQHGYSRDLAKCVHFPVAADLPTPRNIREQPWMVLHELAHAYHDQVLGFDEPRIRAAYERYKASGRGDAALLFDGKHVRHYALTDEKEFFAEMTEAYFGTNDFFPFNRAELMTGEPEIFELLEAIWKAAPGEQAAK